jgi:hypothetical protein
MRAAILAVLAATMAMAARTTVTQSPIAGPGGRLASGTITITAVAPFTSINGVRVETTSLPVPVVNGAFTVSLEPNPPGTVYQAHWQLDGGKPRDEYWSVPVSATPLHLDNVTSMRVVPGTIVQLSQVAQGGATDGQVAAFDAAAGIWAPRSVSGVSGNVTSVFGRTGTVTPLVTDYGAFYAPLASTYTPAPHQLLGPSHSDAGVSAAPVLGDIMVGGITGWTRLGGNTAATQKYLCQTGTGISATASTWCVPPAGSYAGCTPDGSNGITCTGGMTASGFTSADPAHSGGVFLQGKTSGGFAIAARDSAGPLATFYWPTTAPIMDQVPAFKGSVACDPNLPANMPSTCYQLAWTAPGAGAVSTPGSATDPCTAGQWSYDASYHYDCVATNTWVRAALSTWTGSAAAIPAFNNDAGTYANDVAVTITDSTSGATICYTTDGSTPAATTPGTCSTGSTYSSAVTVAATGSVLKAVGTKSGLTNSGVKSATYTLTVATPTDAPGTGTYSSTQSVTLASATTGAYICYTTDGSTPAGTATSCTTGTHYTGAISITATTTVKAIGYKATYGASSVLSSAYTISAGGGGISVISLGGAGCDTGTAPVCASTGSVDPLVTAGVNTTGATLLRIHVVIFNGSSTQTITDSVGGNNNNSCWVKEADAGSTIGTNTAIYSCYNPTHVGAGHTFSCGGAQFTYCAMAVMAYSGTAGTTGDKTDHVYINVAGTSVQMDSTTPSFANELVSSHVGIFHGSVGFSSVTSWPSVVVDGTVNATSTSPGIALAHSIQTTATTVNPLWTANGSQYLSSSLVTNR